MWKKWATRLLTILALIAVVGGLVVLALPDDMEGQELVKLDATHSVRVADLVGAGMIGAGALLIWVTVLAWQRRHIES